MSVRLLFTELRNPVLRKYRHKFNVDEYIEGAKVTCLRTIHAILSEEFRNYCKGLVPGYSPCSPGRGLLLRYCRLQGPNSASKYLNSVYGRKFLYGRLFKDFSTNTYPVSHSVSTQLIRSNANMFSSPIEFQIIDWKLADVKVEVLNGMSFGFPKGACVLTIKSSVTVCPVSTHSSVDTNSREGIEKKSLCPRVLEFSMFACVSSQMETKWRIHNLSNIHELLWYCRKPPENSFTSKGAQPPSADEVIDLSVEDEENSKLGSKLASALGFAKRCLGIFSSKAGPAEELSLNTNTIRYLDAHQNEINKASLLSGKSAFH
jgi:hypothetical protein